MRRVATLSLLLVVAVHGAAIAYEAETHAQLAIKSASRGVSSIDRVLTFELGLSGGVTTTFRGVARPGLRRVDELIGDGALSEDIPSFRSLNHFHNPLIDPWDDAGLRSSVANHPFSGSKTTINPRPSSSRPCRCPRSGEGGHGRMRAGDTWRR